MTDDEKLEPCDKNPRECSRVRCHVPGECAGLALPSQTRPVDGAFTVEETPAGPKLKFNGVQITSWFGTEWNNRAHGLAAELNAATVNARPKIGDWGDKSKGGLPEVSEVADYSEKVTAKEVPSVGVEDPPCGAQCTKDEDCGNFNFHGEGCSYDPKLNKKQVWDALHTLEKSKHSFSVPMGDDKTMYGPLSAEQGSFLHTVLLFAYHKADAWPKPDKITADERGEG